MQNRRCCTKSHHDFHICYWKQWNLIQGLDPDLTMLSSKKRKMRNSIFVFYFAAAPSKELTRYGWMDALSKAKPNTSPALHTRTSQPQLLIPAAIVYPHSFVKKEKEEEAKQQTIPSLFFTLLQPQAKN